ncbi:MAG: nucleotidyltransferase [Anaerolineales bacterium]|nr:MAG: nucleotidyltransferase [Anaerolineales bacterium]
MGNSSLKIVIPMAGYGARLRPITWSRPKQLIRMADKLVIDHLMDSFATIPDLPDAEFIFIIGYLGEKIENYIHQAYPGLKITFVYQPVMLGQSHAISLAKQFLGGPMLMVFPDTLIETDYSFLSSETAGGITWVKAVPDPRRFGVAEVGADGWVTHLIEKPKDLSNNLVLVGGYYFKSSADLLLAIDEQIERNITLKGEFFLADAVNIMLEHGLKMRTHSVDVWLDAGTPDDVLSTSRFLLDHGHISLSDANLGHNCLIIPPVFIHPTASVQSSIIGPHAVIGANCKIEGCIIRDSIIEDSSEISNVILEHSLIGQKSRVYHKTSPLNIGDQTELNL